MSLWVRRTGQLFIAALFLMACEDENSLLGFRNPNRKFSVDFIDIPLTSHVLLIDSVRSDNQQGGQSRLVSGRYTDEDLGEVTATFFSQLRPGLLDTLPPESVYDSIVVELQLDYYAYGSSGISQESITIHEITEDSISYSLPLKPYYFNDKLGYGPSMGEKQFEIDYAVLKKQLGLSRPDSIVTVRVKLNENTDFSSRLFNLMKNNPDNAFKDARKFRYAIKGLAVTAANISNSIIGYTGSPASRTRLTVYYHVGTDALSRPFFLDIGSFNNYETNRIGDLAGKQPYEAFQPASGKRYLQNGTPVITTLDLANFYTAMQEVPTTLFNAAEFIIEAVDNPDELPPPPTINLRTIKENNFFYNRTNFSDRDFMANQWVVSDGDFFNIRSDIVNAGQALPVALTFQNGRYTGNATLFVQDIFSKRSLNPRLERLALFSTGMGRTVNRAIFDESKVRLRVYFTVPADQ
jgi:hypothetical protein